ncbi:MAG TPA: hypothetical protein VHL52_13625 [Acidimicrobiia bacterium]|nr:hypothetical protein [Acidimicrobiia bacterium]
MRLVHSAAVDEDDDEVVVVVDDVVVDDVVVERVVEVALVVGAAGEVAGGVTLVEEEGTAITAGEGRVWRSAELSTAHVAAVAMAATATQAAMIPQRVMCPWWRVGARRTSTGRQGSGLSLA